MKTISQINREYRDKQTEMFNRYGVIFAFSDKQFEQQRKQGMEYISAGCGMLVPQDNEDLVFAELEALRQRKGEEMRSNVPREQYIFDALNNYECFWTGDVDNALEDALNYYPDCSYDEVFRIYIKYLPNAEF